MAQPQVTFQSEYVSGIAAVPPQSGTGGPFQIAVALFNRGVTPVTVRVYIYQQDPPAVVSQSRDEVVAPGDLFYEIYEPVAGNEIGVPPGNYWLRIWTTLTDIVPTVTFQEVDSTATNFTLTQYAYFGPGDFAIFPLPIGLPPLPPIRPGREA